MTRPSWSSVHLQSGGSEGSEIRDSAVARSRRLVRKSAACKRLMRRDSSATWALSKAAFRACHATNTRLPARTTRPAMPTRDRKESARDGARADTPRAWHGGRSSVNGAQNDEGGAKSGRKVQCLHFKANACMSRSRGAPYSPAIEGAQRVALFLQWDSSGTRSRMPIHSLATLALATLDTLGLAYASASERAPEVQHLHMPARR